MKIKLISLFILICGTLSNAHSDQDAASYTGHSVDYSKQDDSFRYVSQDELATQVDTPMEYVDFDNVEKFQNFVTGNPSKIYLVGDGSAYKRWGHFKDDMLKLGIAKKLFFAQEGIYRDEYYESSYAFVSHAANDRGYVRGLEDASLLILNRFIEFYRILATSEDEGMLEANYVQTVKLQHIYELCDYPAHQALWRLFCENGKIYAQHTKDLVNDLNAFVSVGKNGKFDPVKARKFIEHVGTKKAWQALARSYVSFLVDSEKRFTGEGTPRMEKELISKFLSKPEKYTAEVRSHFGIFLLEYCMINNIEALYAEAKEANLPLYVVVKEMRLMDFGYILRMHGYQYDTIAFYK